MMKNKRGFIMILIPIIIVLVLVFAVIFITYLLSNKLIAGLGSQWFLYAGIFILLLVFKQQAMMVFKTFWQYATKYPWIILVILALVYAYKLIPN